MTILFSRTWKGMIFCWNLRGQAWFSWARVSAERGERCPRTRDFPWAGSARQTPECTWTHQRCRWWVSLPSGCLFENSPAKIPHSIYQKTFYKKMKMKMFFKKQSNKRIFHCGNENAVSRQPTHRSVGHAGVGFKCWWMNKTRDIYNAKKKLPVVKKTFTRKESLRRVLC